MSKQVQRREDRGGGPPAVAQAAPAATQADRAAAQWDRWLTAQITQVIGAMPMNVNESDLKRARAQMRVAFTRAHKAHQIWECTPESIAACIVMSAVTGLFPGGHAPDVDIIPRKNRHNGNRLELNWQISFRGYIRLARRTPGWNLQPFVVFEGDEFDYEFGTRPFVHHKPRHRLGDGVLRDPKTAWQMVKFIYPVVTYQNPQIPDAPVSTFFDVLDKGQIEARRACAQNQAFWGPWPIEMCLKTACRFAGQREMYPTDDPTRYALLLDIEAEKRSGTVISAGSAPPPALPPPAEPLPAGLDQVAGVLDDRGQPAQVTQPAQAGPVTLSADQIDRIKGMCDEQPAISFQELEEHFGGPLHELVADEGEDQGALHTRVLGVVRDRKKAVAKPKGKK